jgi:hypothetical protein
MSETKSKSDVVVFSDTTGRVLIGQYQGVEDDVTLIKNPMIVNAQDRGQGQMALGCIPYTFMEIFDADADAVWAFPTQTLVWFCGKVSEQYIGLYEQVVIKYSETRLQMKQAEEQADSGIVGEDGDVIDFTK